MRIIKTNGRGSLTTSRANKALTYLDPEDLKAQAFADFRDLQENKVNALLFLLDSTVVLVMPGVGDAEDLHNDIFTPDLRQACIGIAEAFAEARDALRAFAIGERRLFAL